MPTLPWTTVEKTRTDEVVVMASRFHVRGFRHVLPFFLDAMRVHGQVRRSPGAVGVSLIAHPLRREFYTLSAWHDREALNRMVRTEPHRSVMGRHKEAMADSHFTFWNQAADVPVTWAEAHRRLAE